MQQTLSHKPTRREFLNYIWGASMALALAQAGRMTFLFALPRLPRDSTVFSVGELPQLGGKPVSGKTERAGFHLTHSERGIAAFDNRCTHNHCVFPWAEDAEIFSCPCHGSQFKLNGDYIAGPAPRSLDRYDVEILDVNGRIIASSQQGRAVPLPEGADYIRVRTAPLFQGDWHVDHSWFPEYVPTAMPPSPTHEH